jgi:hypothetical protein
MTGMKRSKVGRQLMTTLAIESNDVVVEEVEVLPESESASAEAIETLGDTAEVNALNDEAEDLQNIDESGDELIAAVENAVANDRPLTPIEAVALNKVVQRLTGKYTKGFIAVMPAREAYGGTADAMDTTVLALEKLQEGFAAFWESAKKHFLRVIETIKTIFRNIIQRFNATTKRAMALKARAGDSNGNGENEVEIDIRNLRMGSKEINTSILDGLSDIKDVISELLKNTRNLDDRVSVDKGVQALLNPPAWKDFVNDMNSKAERTFHAIPALKEGTSAILPGDRAITITKGTPESRDQFSYESLVQFGEDNVDNVEKKVPALGKKQIIAVADFVIDIANEIGLFDKLWSRSATKAERMVQSVSKKTVAVDKEVKDETPEARQERIATFKINISALMNHIRRLDKFNSDLVTYVQSVSLDVLTYGEKSLNEVAVNPEASAPTTV